MALFPDVLALAKAEEEAVLKAWEGLGYYSRARNLQKAARIVRDQHAGQFPAAYDQVLNLPGIGRYTAGAICSIAFGQAKPILDGNVARVLSRIFTVSGSIKAREIQEALWKLSAQLVALAGNSSALNQGLMELGATLCVPRAPLCPKCPVRKACAAFQTDRVPEFPARTGGPRFRKREFIAFILQRDGQVLLRRRSVEVVNGGLWEFPNLEIRPNGKKDREALLAEMGIYSAPLATIRHTITRNRITLRAFGRRVNGGPDILADKFEAQWRLISDLQRLPFSSAHAKLRALLQGAHAAENKGPAA